MGRRALQVGHLKRFLEHFLGTGTFSGHLEHFLGNAKVTEVRPPAIERSGTLFARIFNTDGGAWVRRILTDLGTTEVYPYLKWADKCDDAPETPASTFTALLEELDRFRREMLAFLEGYDVVLAPVHAYPALAHDELMSEARRPAFSYCQTYNLTGWASVVVRAGTSKAGLPYPRYAAKCPMGHKPQSCRLLPA